MIQVDRDNGVGNRFINIDRIGVRLQEVGVA